MSPKLKTFYDYIKAGKFTSYSQAQRDFGWTSKNSVHKKVLQLKKLGYELTKKSVYLIKKV